MPHGQEQVIRERKVKLSAVMVYSSSSPYQDGEEGEVADMGRRCRERVSEAKGRGKKVKLPAAVVSSRNSPHQEEPEEAQRWRKELGGALVLLPKCH